MEKLVRVFFSQPMHGFSKEYICEERATMMNEFIEFYHEKLGVPEDSTLVVQDVYSDFYEKAHILHSDGAEMGRIYYLGRAIQRMEAADYIVFHKDFQKAMGCQIEEQIAMRYYDYTIGYNNTVRYADGHYKERWELTDHISHIYFGRNDDRISF